MSHKTSLINSFMNKAKKEEGTESFWAKPCYTKATGSFSTMAVGGSDHHPNPRISISSKPALLLAGVTPPVPQRGYRPTGVLLSQHPPCCKGQIDTIHFSFPFHRKKNVMPLVALLPTSSLPKIQC